MKRNKRNIVYSWIVLLLFVAGQYMVFAHTHYKHGNIIVTSKSSLPLVKEKCDICDAMHHTHMLLNQHVYFTPVVAVQSHNIYIPSGVTLIQLVLASGRAPPVTIS